MDMSPAVDCHNHLIDSARFPFVAAGGYRLLPHETGNREALASVLESHSMSHALIVQPSCYGTDNRALLDAIAWKPDRFKGIAVLDPDISERELVSLRARGFVGVRFNLQYYPDALTRSTTPSFLARLKEHGWFIQVHGRDSDWAAAAPILRKSGAKLLLDHIGLGTVDGGSGQKGFQAVLGLGRDTNAVIKLSAPFRASRLPPLCQDVDSFVELVLQAFGVSRCVWGSDWPFISMLRRPTYEEVLVPLKRWLPREGDRRAVLWENPSRLFGFKSKATPR
jgi:predicted TIM-barrel fold metal-dependent hydrolase